MKDIVAGMFEHLTPAVLQAGRQILAMRNTSLCVEEKPDGSPVTPADKCANDVLLDALHRYYPHIAVVSEEALEQAPVELPRRYFLVDPLDGTRTFIRGGREFTVNIGLIADTVPVFGIVYAPALGQFFAVDCCGRAVFAEIAAPGSHTPVLQNLQIMRVRDEPVSGPVIVTSRSLSAARTKEYLHRFKAVDFVKKGSSLKFCLLARGEADIYPRLSPTMAWDTAAGDAILRAAGGTMSIIEGAPFIYGANRAINGNVYINPWFVARGGAAMRL